MEIIDAIKKRKSIRKFKSDPVPREVLKEILDMAVKSPSAINTQPWEFIVIAGDVIENIKQGNVEMLRSGKMPDSEFAQVEWAAESEYKKRQVELARQLFRLMDIKREDKEKRTQWSERGFRYFDAPAAIILTSDRALPLAGPALDIGAVMMSICLASLHFNLGTCIENQGVMYPQIVRKYADISESRILVTSIAIGYPDITFPANKVESERESVDKITTWCGI